MLSLSMLSDSFFILYVSDHEVPRERYQQISTKPHLAGVCMHLRFQVGSVVRIAAVRAKPQTFTFKMLPNTSTPSSCSKKPLVYSFKSNACSLNHNNRLLLGRGSAKLSSKPKANRSEGRSSQLLLAFLFFWESGLHFLVPPPAPAPKKGPQLCPGSTADTRVSACARRAKQPTRGRASAARGAAFC